MPTGPTESQKHNILHIPINRSSNVSRSTSMLALSIENIARNVSMNQSSCSKTESAYAKDDKMRGWLHKWTNYLKGYQRRWFVLNDGILSYYRNQTEMQFTCRGTIYLSTAIVVSLDSCHFLIRSGGTSMHLKAANEREKQKWISVLELAKSKAVHYDRIFQNEDESEDEEGKNTSTDSHSRSPETPRDYSQPTFELNRDLIEKLEEVENYFDLSKKHHHLLQKQVATLDSLAPADVSTFMATTKVLNERATIFRVTITSLINACRAFVSIARKQAQQWQRAYMKEHELRVQLDLMVEQMARQMKNFERSLFKADKEGKAVRFMVPESVDANTVLTEDEQSITSTLADDDFHDALDSSEDLEEIVRMPLPSSSVGPLDTVDHRVIQDDQESDEEDDDDRSTGKPSVLIKIAHPARGERRDQSTTEKSPVFTSGAKKVRRTKIPAKPDYSLNLWGIIKNCIGKDLSRIPVPVNFSEPISMLQRLTEELEYSELLDRAAKFDSKRSDH
ncbi:hypothetical protein ACOME3_007672 [Neoechinorhynchus agilis]